MKRLALVGFAALAVSACSTEVRYVTPETTDAPTTTVRATTTTQPSSSRPPASVPQSSSRLGGYNPELYDDFLWDSVNDFWWLFSQEQLLTMGLIVCEEFDRGQTLDEVTMSLLETMSNTNTLDLMEGMAAVVAGAVTFLCDEHAWWLATI